jgi:uncharacterized protein YjcR
VTNWSVTNELEYLRQRYADDTRKVDRQTGISKLQLKQLFEEGYNESEIARTLNVSIERIQYLKRRWELNGYRATRKAEAYKRLSKDYYGTMIDKEICREWGISPTKLFRLKRKWKEAGEL